MKKRSMIHEKYHEVYINPESSAREAGLTYITDSAPGISRKRKGKGFIYVSSNGKIIRDKKKLERIGKLKIPPAWKKVWISPSENSHLQVTGFDASGRKQYLYHKDWKELRSIAKYDRMVDFAKKLPKIRKRNRANLKIPGMPLQKVLALITEILDKTFIRIGNEEYERDNKSFGITTLRNRHVRINKNEVRFRFIAKSGKQSNLSFKDKLLSRLVRRCKEIPGYHLFQYIDENGLKHEINSNDVNDYIKEISGEYFTSKDFRTWAGTVNAFKFLKNCIDCNTETERKNAIIDCVKVVAKKLNNTVAICKKYYIHPKILEKFSEGKVEGFTNNNKSGNSPSTRLSNDEKCVLKLLKY